MASAPLLDKLAASAAADVTPSVAGAPDAPNVVGPKAGARDFNLWNNVWDALHALPGLFQSDLSIDGVLATDLHAFNTSLGASIEQQVVAAPAETEEE